MSEWKLETKVSNDLKYYLDGMYTYYDWEETELYGRKYLKVRLRDQFSNVLWPETYFTQRWTHTYQDTRPIDICNITMTGGPDGGTFYVAEILKKSWNSAPYEWKRHNRSVVGY